MKEAIICKHTKGSSLYKSHTSYIDRAGLLRFAGGGDSFHWPGGVVGRDHRVRLKVAFEEQAGFREMQKGKGTLYFLWATTDGAYMLKKPLNGIGSWIGHQVLESRLR